MSVNNLSIQHLTDEDAVYFDKSAVMSTGFRELMMESARGIRENGHPVFVHNAVCKELKLAVDSDDEALSLESANCLGILTALESRNVVQFVGNALEPGASGQQYLELLVKYRSKKKICMISNDPDFLSDVALQNKIRSFTGNRISACILNDDGQIIDAEENNDADDYTDEDDDCSNAFEETKRFLKMFGL